MSVTAPDAGPVDLEGIDRADAQARALEAAIAAAVTAVIAARVAGIVKDLTDAFGWAATAPARWRTARFYAAARLRSVPVRLAETLEPQLHRAAVLGARMTGQPLPGGYDPTVREDIRGMLDGLDTTVRDRLRDAARVVESGRIDTPAQLAQTTAKIDAVTKTTRARVEDTVARTVADGAQAAVYSTTRPPAAEQPGPSPASGGGHEESSPTPPQEPASGRGGVLELTWWSERNACFIPSTRVLAPSIDNAPLGSTDLMPLSPGDRFAFDPSALHVGHVGDPGGASTAAAASPIGHGLRNVESVTTRYYVGDVISIETLGQKLTGTPNHPIATNRGWVPLGQIKVGDYVLCRVDGERVLDGIHPDDYDAPPTIQEVAESLTFAVTDVVPTSSEDFHGDGSGSKVHVVRSNRLLVGELGSKGPKHGPELSLQVGDVQLPLLNGGGVSDLRCETDRPMTGGYAVPGEVSLHPGFAAPIADCDIPDSLTGGIPECDLISIRNGEAIPPDSVTGQPGDHQRVADSEHFCELLSGLAGVIELREVVSVGKFDFSGHVLNLQTRQSWYLAEGIVVHNCLVCKSLSGSTPDNDGLFRPVLSVSERPNAYIASGVVPPAHPSCRCRLVPATPGLADSLRREAQREVAYGWSAYDSLRARLRATDLLLRGGASRLPKTVVGRAREAVDRGEFTQPPPPR